MLWSAYAEETSSFHKSACKKGEGWDLNNCPGKDQDNI